MKHPHTTHKLLIQEAEAEMVQFGSFAIDVITALDLDNNGRVSEQEFSSLISSQVGTLGFRVILYAFQVLTTYNLYTYLLQL